MFSPVTIHEIEDAFWNLLNTYVSIVYFSVTIQTDFGVCIYIQRFIMQRLF